MPPPPPTHTAATTLPQAADLVLWVGISFQQSASVEYFRRVRTLLGGMGRLTDVPQVRGGGWRALGREGAEVRRRRYTQTSWRRTLSVLFCKPTRTAVQCYML